MPGDREWAGALAAFDALIELEPGARAARLEAMRETDPALARSVEPLLAADADSDRALARVDAALRTPGSPGAASPPRDPLHLVGRTVSRFRVIEPLAHGGMGVVYRAEDTGLRRTVALKFPLPAQHLDTSADERFLHEARAVAALDHPNLCAIYETGQTAEGHLFLAMPLYPGETLKARLAREGALPPEEAARIAGQLARGLGAAHRAGIVHRDLKPANVMLLPDGTAKILDFGLAKVSDLSLTAPWTRLGTAAYMAPEQVQDQPLDGRTDLWALGVVLYEMLAGVRPFGGEREVSVAHAIVHDEPPRVAALRAGVPAALDAIVHRLLRKDPAERFASAEEVAAALASDRPVPAVPRRRPVRALVVACIALAAVAVAARLASRAETVPPIVRVAVLPFQPSGDAEAGEYLATGLTDGVITELSRLGGVVVPGYPTVSRYRDGGKPLSRIARELQVGSVLEAGVRAAAGSVQVEARLLDAKDGRPRWTRRYQRPAGELADLQRELTRETAKALGLRLTRAERALLERPAAVRPGAYATYLRGRAAELAGHPRELWTIIPPDQVRRAQSLYSQARDLDPDFALARARLALMHTWSSWLYDTTSARREQARLEAETALRLRPGLAEAHEALAHYWQGRRDLARAIEERKLAIQGLPNSAGLRQDLGNTYAQAGRLEEAAAQLDSGMQLDPGSPNAAFAAGMFHSRLRRGEAAMRAYDRALALAPDYHMVKVIKGHTWLRWKGTADTLAAALAGIPRDWDPRGMATWARYTALRVQRRDAEALIMLDSSPSELSRDGLVYQPEPLMRAQLHEALGQRGQARAHYAAARALLLDSVRARPGDASIHVALGLASAGLGRRADAVREARRAMELVAVGDNTPAATAFMGVAAEVFAKAGETGEAIELLELLFAMPAGREVTIAYLEVWPGFDPLRGDARFEELLERYGGSARPGTRRRRPAAPGPTTRRAAARRGCAD